MNRVKYRLDKMIDWFAEIQPWPTQIFFVERYARGVKER